MRKIEGQCTSKVVINHLKGIFQENGIPERVISDNGPQYSSEEFREFARKWEFDHITSSPGFPQSNGMIERAIQTVKNCLKDAKESAADPDLALLNLRTTPIDHKLPSPSEMLNTRKLRGTLPVRIRDSSKERENRIERLEERQEIQKRYHDRSTRDLPELQPGQEVLIKGTDHWKSGVILDKREEPRSYSVQTNSGVLRRNRVHLRPKGVKKVTFQDVPQQDRPSPELERDPDPVYPDPVHIDDESRESTVVEQPYQTRSGRSVKTPARYLNDDF